MQVIVTRLPQLRMLDVGDNALLSPYETRPPEAPATIRSRKRGSDATRHSSHISKKMTTSHSRVSSHGLPSSSTLLSKLHLQCALEEIMDRSSTPHKDISRISSCNFRPPLQFSSSGFVGHCRQRPAIQRPLLHQPHIAMQLQAIPSACIPFFPGGDRPR